MIQQYYSSLIRSHGGFVQSSPPEKSPFTVFPLEGPSKIKPRKSHSGDSHSNNKKGADVEDEEMDVDADVVKEEDKVRVRPGQTGSTEQEVLGVLKDVLKGKRMPPCCRRKGSLEC